MSNLNPSIGSYWRRWDLHVHTPASLYHNYDNWDAFLGDLEALPAEFAVLGINDYLFLDGYERLLNERAQGRIQNISNILPVVEFRLAMYGGTLGHLSKVNFHVIFSEELEPNLIRSQFLNALTSKYRLNPYYKDQVEWKGVVTRESLEDLGKQIKKTVPGDKLDGYSTDLMEGFRNLTLDPDQIREVLKSPYFAEKYRTAIGKTEWADIKWNDHSIADKKNIINDAHSVFIAAQTASHFAANRDALLAANVNSRLLDCSDAHNHSSLEDKDRIGNCLTWINADPTFEGLCHAIHDYESRVFIGELPQQLVALQTNPGQYVQRITISKTENSDLQGKWFDLALDLNPGFSAVIGNKGMGKSALVDVIGLLGSSREEDSFSFLHSKKFRHPRSNKAQSFDATITWHSGQGSKKNLNDRVDPADVERVRYLPQSLLDTLCNEDPVSGDSEFESELGEVIFSHVDTADRLGCNSIDELIQRKSQPIDRRLQIVRDELQIINKEIAALERRLSPANIERTKRELALRREELAAHDSERPHEVEKPADDPDDPVSKALLTQLEENEGKHQALKEALQTAQSDAKHHALVEAATGRVLRELTNLERTFDSFRETIAADLEFLNLAVPDVAELTTHRTQLETLATQATNAKATAQDRLDASKPGSLLAREQEIAQEAQAIIEKLDAPKRRYQSYLQEVQDWEANRSRLQGDDSTSGTITFLEKTLLEYEGFKPRLEGLRQQRQDKVREIHAQLVELADIYRALYEPVQRFTDVQPLAAEHFDLRFEVSLVLSLSSLSERLFEHMISRSATGTFFGIDESAKLLEQWSSTIDPNDLDQVLGFAERIDEALHTDMRQGRNETEMLVADQLRNEVQPEEVYDLVFSLDFVHPRYVLQSRGEPISRLSPGEKGTLLLMFYLLVDKDTSPIIIDQPEENLDSQTVFDLLVPAIKYAKNRRQVILVTHSPNLAVVGDADQVICADFQADEFTYIAGSIENPSINQKILDILEGTILAFQDRGQKYIGLPWRRTN